MRVDYLSRRFYPDLYGGLEVSGWRLVRAWQAAGVPVRVVAENYPDGPTRRDEVLPGVEAVRLAAVGNRPGLWRVAPVARVLWWAAKLAALPAAPVAVAASAEWVLASKLARPGRPVVYRMVEVSELTAAAGGRRLERLEVAAERLAARAADHVVVESSHIRGQALSWHRLPPHRVSVVHTGVDVDRFAAAGPAPEVGKVSPPGEFRVACVARLSPEKDIGFLIRAAAAMKARDRVRVLLVGTGADRPLLEKLAAELGVAGRVTFVGKVPDPERYLKAADAFVLPSRSEPYGAALIEAMAAGLPGVGRRTAPPAVQVANEDHVLDGRTGFLCDPHDPRDLAAKLDVLAADPGLRKRMGAAAAARALELYTQEAMADEYLRIAADLLARRNAGGR